MSGLNFSVFLSFVFWICSTVQVKAETEIFCVFMQRCILPCSFQGSDDVFIHWFQQKAESLHVHSYYNNTDQLDSQNQNFKNRTSLFQDQLSRGNASLLLTGVKVEDQSRYRCFCSTIKSNKKTFLQLSVDAPVSDIRIHQDGNRTTCSSEGIYPQPELTWSTEPPSNTALQSRTTVHQTEEKLYDISSSLTGPDGSDRIYSCTIRTRRNQRRATLRQTSVIVSSRQTSLSCSASNVSVSKFLWRFNYSQVIVSRSSESRATVAEEWKPHVKQVSESGGLSLQDLTPQQDGIYTCELSNQEETFTSSTFLKVEEERGEKSLPSKLKSGECNVSVHLFLLRRNKTPSRCFHLCCSSSSISTLCCSDPPFQGEKRINMRRLHISMQISNAPSYFSLPTCIL